MTTRKIASGLTEAGRRALAQFLAENLNDKTLAHLLSAWENDVIFDTRDYTAGHIEIRGMHTDTGNPITRTFDGDEVEFEDIEIEE